MTLKGWIVLALVLLARPALPQNAPPALPKAHVTLYSSGSFWKSAKPGYKHGDFAGRIFIGDDQLATIRPGHFVTFALDPGIHTFSAGTWLLTKPVGAAHLQVDLQPGQHYDLGTYLETTLLFGSEFRIELSDCDDAQKDNLKTRPLDAKHLKDYGKTRVVTQTSFPPCT
jgi:hypothetical protein